MYEEIINYKYGVPIFVSTPINHQSSIIKKGTACNMHLHRQYEFLYIHSGSMICQSTDNKLKAEKGDILFVNSYTPHWTRYEVEGMEQILLQFDLPTTSDLSLKYVTRFSKVTDTPMYLFKSNEKDTEELKKCILSIADECYYQNDFWKEYVNANILMIMAILHRKKIISDSIRKREAEINKIKPAIEYINENYSQDISTAELSRLLGFNESYFCRLFKNAVGTNAIEYINFVRVCKAEHLLTKNISISDIASTTGFSSLSYFNRIFKKYNAYTPSEYKKILTSTNYEQIQ